MAFAVGGIGLTNECNLCCPHCYRPDMVIDLVISVGYPTGLRQHPHEVNGTWG